MVNCVGTATRRRFLTGLGGAGCVLAAPALVRAQAVDLSFSSWLPAENAVRQNMMDVWVEDVARITDGRVRIRYTDAPLGPPPAHADLLREGTADIAFSIHGYTQDAFPRAEIGQFSFLGDAYGASHAFSKVYSRLLDAKAEHADFRLLGLFQHGPGVLMLKGRTIRDPQDFEGLRLRTAGGYVAGLMRDLGAENVSMSPFAARDALAAGEIDGVAFPYEGGPVFGVTGEVSYVSELPGGYFNSTFFLGMSHAAAERIAPDDLALIEAHSAQTVHALAAKAFDHADFVARQSFVEAGVEIEVAPAAVVEHVASVAQGYEAEWVARMQTAGYDGAKALAFTRRITSGN